MPAPSCAARRSLRSVLLGSLLALVAAPGAWGAVTIGPPLDLPPNVGEGCEAVVIPALRPTIGTPDSCTFFGLDTAGQWTSQTPPGRWVIVRARVRAPQNVGPMVLTVVRNMRSKAGAGGTICCNSPAESQVFTPTPNAISTIPMRVRAVATTEVVDNEQIEVVDYLGMSLVSRAGHVPAHVAQNGAPGAGAQLSFFAPAMRAGQERLSDGSFPAVTPLINADLEPDADDDGLGDETQDSCPIAAAGGTAARARTAQSGSCRLRPRTTSVRANRSGRVSFVVVDPVAATRTRRSTFTLRRGKSTVGRVRLAASPGNRRTVRISLSRSGRAALRRASRGRLKLTLTATYPRASGKAITARASVTIRR